MASKFGRARRRTGIKTGKGETRPQTQQHTRRAGKLPTSLRARRGRGRWRWRTHIVAESSHYQRELVERKQYVRAAAQREVGKVHDVDGVDKGVVRRRVVVVDADQVYELADLLLPQHLG